MQGLRIFSRSFFQILVSLIVLASASTSVMAADRLKEIKERGFIRVGTFSIPPESWIDINSGEWLGVDADFSKAIAKSLGVEYDPVILTHAALAPALQSGRVDVIAGLYKTPGTRKGHGLQQNSFLVRRGRAGRPGGEQSERICRSRRARRSAPCVGRRRKGRRRRYRRSSALERSRSTSPRIPC